jgi:hypothetical protein
MAEYVAGPLFLVKPSDRLPDGAITVSHCLAVVAPDTWAIEWASATAEERAESAARCGISNNLIAEAIAWTTDHFERGFAWSHVFLESAVALEFRDRFLPLGFRLLQIGLPERFLPSFLALAAPVPQQAGYAPNGATGVYQALLRQDALPVGTHRLGFEVLGYDRYGGGFDSYRCNAFEQPFAELGAVFNPAGLIEDESMALRCADLANSPEIGTCADGWHPWLILEHAER